MLTYTTAKKKCVSCGKPHPRGDFYGNATTCRDCLRAGYRCASCGKFQKYGAARWVNGAECCPLCFFGVVERGY